MVEKESEKVEVCDRVDNCTDVFESIQIDRATDEALLVPCVCMIESDASETLIEIMMLI
jgi:hypothetical protein